MALKETLCVMSVTLGLLVSGYPVEGAAQTVDPESRQRPWRLHSVVGLRWLRFGIVHRSRFEYLANDFRRSNPGDAYGYLMRTLVTVEAHEGIAIAGAELEDSRVWANESAPLNTTLVDTVELLQGYIGLRANGVFTAGDSLAITAGRMTLDLGSRRLVARNRYRNTINGFTGLGARWQSPAGDRAEVFAVMPVMRLPGDPTQLRDQRVVLDRENTDTIFWGGFFQSRRLSEGLTAEGYFFALDEGDDGGAPTANRRISTLGLRALRAPEVGRFDAQLEAMAQFGRSRATTAQTDTVDLVHRAFSLHVTAGYTLALRGAPRIAFLYDYASGDSSPTDGENNRFDLLYGARRSDFGPTGFYGVIARSNVDTPGARFELAPHRKVDLMVTYRAMWLASARDAWTTAGYRDPTGASGSFIGHQVETRIVWRVIPRNLAVELGGAVLAPGSAARGTAGPVRDPSVYFYSQLTGEI